MTSNIKYSNEYINTTGNSIQVKNGSLIGDSINNLPFDQTIPTHNEIKLVNSLFKEQKSIFFKILDKSKDLLVLALFFIIFSLPQIDSIIKKFISITNNSLYILISIKALLFVFTYFIINNLYLAKK